MLEVVLALTSVLGWMGVGLMTSRSNAVLKELIETRLSRVDASISHIEEIAKDGKERIFELERKLLEFKSEVARSYVGREDWIRFGAVLDAKLDRLSEKMEAMRGPKL